MKQKPGARAAHLFRGAGPERLGRPAPGPLEHIRQHEHGHVAAHAVALPGDAQQFPDHRLLKRRIGVVELQRVRPAREVRVAPVREDPVARGAGDPREVRRRQGEVLLRAADEVLGVLVDPGMVQGHVIGHEVEHQPEAARPQPLAEPGEGRVASQGVRHGVPGDGESGAGDVVLRASRGGSPRTPCATRRFARDTRRPAGPVCHTLNNQTQSKPCAANRSRSASGTSSSVAGRPSWRDNSVSQTLVLTW